MKTPISTLAVIAILVLSGISHAQAINNTDDKTSVADPETHSVFLIEESDFSCFKDMNCLKRDNDIRRKGLHIGFENNSFADRYVLRGDSRNEKVHAVYANNGRLISAILVRTNIILPKTISHSLLAGELAGWTMIGNEMTINNFDSRTTEYKVILQKNGEGKILYFDRKGNTIDKFPAIS